MKNFIVGILIVLSIMPLVTSAQIKYSDQSKLKTTNSTVSVTSSNAPARKIEIKSTSLRNLQNQVARQSSIKNLKEIKLSPEEMERNRVKSWELTPQNPYNHRFKVALSGSDYNWEGFYLQPRPATIGYYMFSMFIECYPAAGKDYKLTLDVKDTDRISGSAQVVISLGAEQYRIPVSSGQKQVSVFFTNTSSGSKSIAVSPLISFSNGKENWGTFSITKINLEELIPAG